MNEMNEMKGLRNVADHPSLERGPECDTLNDRSRVSRIWLRLRLWFYHESGYIIMLWCLLHSALFVYFYIDIMNNHGIEEVIQELGWPLIVAKTSAALLNIDFGVILLTVSLRLLTYLSRFSLMRRVLNMDRHKHMHRVIGRTIALFSIAHVAAHVFNMIKISTLEGTSFLTLWFVHPTNATGNIALVILVIMYLTSVKYVRRTFFDTFIGVHQVYIILYAVLMVHGAFCFVKASTGPACHGPQFYKFTIPSLAIFLADKLFSLYFMRCPVSLVSVTEKASNTFELKFKANLWLKDGMYRFKAGQYLYVIVPSLAKFQRHPFTITSAPSDEYITVHIMCVGDWTKSLKGYLRSSFVARNSMSQVDDTKQDLSAIIPNIYIDGPYFAPADSALLYDHLVLVGAGIGITPFASICMEYCERMKSKQKLCGKIHLIWISRDAKSFLWFYDLLRRIEDMDIHHSVEISLYWTLKATSTTLCHGVASTMLNNNDRDPVTNLRHAKTYFGRPQWNRIFNRVESAIENIDSKVGVFYCGPKPLGRKLAKISMERSDLMGTQYEFHKEIF
jgi:NADPH oxidase